MATEYIEISDNSDGVEGASTTKKKRKLPSDQQDGRNSWAAESSSDNAWERFKNRKKRSRVSNGSSRAGKSKGTGKGKTRFIADGKTRKRARLAHSVAAINDDSSADDAPDNKSSDDDAPSYLRERRAAFNTRKVQRAELGLMLPPLYDEVSFSDDERPAQLLQCRPQFTTKSGIKPSRSRTDIELPTTGGTIPGPMAQYLRDYQITGARFLHEHFVYQTGCILGDDMGLGKTVQVLAFLTAAFGKTCDERDGKRLRKMRNADAEWYPRVLIVCPGSLIENWRAEMERWGYWAVMVYHGANKAAALGAARAGRLEVMITTYETYKSGKDTINEVAWDAIIADECHKIKDPRSGLTKAMDEVNALCRIGLTGTAIQNNYEELWTLLNWTNPRGFGSRSEWKAMISEPLARGQSHEATVHELSVARSTAKKLVENLLPRFFLRRMKSLIADQLPKKTDKVVFCPLTDLQRRAYQNFLNSEEVEMVRLANDDCECRSGKKRGWCCHRMVPVPVPADESSILEPPQPWQANVFPIIQTLQKLSSHLTLLIPSATYTKKQHASGLRRLKTALPDRWQQLYRERDSLINLANTEYCGKWKVLKKLLRFWHESGDKVLVFSHSVRLLHILRHLFTSTSYTVSYLDGSLSYEDRQKEVDSFNTDASQFVFLISTKAGGVGLNITSANKVVIFDPHWNPAHDLQAQDRAYRIGQTRDVDVFRLVSAGTVEEIVYARQIYKQQQANIGYNASKERRYFSGVQKDGNRKGELFGLKNLFTFDASQVVMRDIVNKTNIAEARAGVHLDEFDMEAAAKDVGHEIGGIKMEPGAGDDASGAGELAALAVAESQGGRDTTATAESGKKAREGPRSDPIQAMLASVGVEYTHENSEVIGESKVETHLSRHAEWALEQGNLDHLDTSGAYLDDNEHHDAKLFSYRYKPPPEVAKRQFCSMAKHFEFENAVDFALVVEGWTQEQRRNCLMDFYEAREAALLLDQDRISDTTAHQGLGLERGIKKEELALKVEQDTPGLKQELDRDRRDVDGLSPTTQVVKIEVDDCTKDPPFKDDVIQISETESDDEL